MFIALFVTPARAQQAARDPYRDLPVPHTYNCYGNGMGKATTAPPTANLVPVQPCTGCGPFPSVPSSTNGLASYSKGEFAYPGDFRRVYGRF